MRFSVQRYKGVSAKLLKERVREIEIVNPHRVRFHLTGPWPDFFTARGGVLTRDFTSTGKHSLAMLT